MRRSLFGRIGRAALDRIGRSAGAGPALRILVAAGRRKLLPSQRAAAAAERIAAGGRATTILAPIVLPDAGRVTLECDVRFDGYRELAINGRANELAARVFVALARNARVAIDVGANAGAFAYAAVAVQAEVRVIAFEPIPALAACLRRNANRNDWTSRLDVREQLVGDRVGSVEFFVLESDMESTLDPERASRGIIREVLSRSITTLDQVIESEGCAPDRVVLKIDVEGHEAAVLAGAARLLASSPPPELIIEFLSKALKLGALESMIERGYDVYYLAPSRFVPVRSLSDFLQHQDLASWNFFCTTRPRADVYRLAEQLGVPMT